MAAAKSAGKLLRLRPIASSSAVTAGSGLPPGGGGWGCQGGETVQKGRGDKPLEGSKRMQHKPQKGCGRERRSREGVLPRWLGRRQPRARQPRLRRTHRWRRCCRCCHHRRRRRHRRPCRRHPPCRPPPDPRRRRRGWRSRLPTPASERSGLRLWCVSVMNDACTSAVAAKFGKLELCGAWRGQHCCA